MMICLRQLLLGACIAYLGVAVSVSSSQSPCPRGECQGEQEDVVDLLQQFSHLRERTIKPTASLGTKNESFASATLQSKRTSPTAQKAGAPKPHIIFMLADDLGWYDTAIPGYGDLWTGSEHEKQATYNLTQLAKDGMILNYHYTHWHCSPSRRAFLTGRSPLHHGEDLSKPNQDHIDLRWTWISEKLKQAGYSSHFYGKGHTGYQSIFHMPAKRGFDGGQVMFLGGAGSYYTTERWKGTTLFHNKSTNPNNYSTDLFGALTVKAIEKHDPSVPLFVYLSWQAVHGPSDPPPWCFNHNPPPWDDDHPAWYFGVDDDLHENCTQILRQVMRDVDVWTGRIVQALKDTGMYSNTLLVFTSDNGGYDHKEPGNNYPLRGEKGSNFQGGVRTVTFINGGFIPDHIRGKVHNGTFHITDWYPTFCRLAGVDGSDDPPVARLSIDMGNPSQDLYGELSFPGVDGIDIWDELIFNKLPQRKYLWITPEVLIKDGRYKLVTAQGAPNAHKVGPSTGWRLPNGSWVRRWELDSELCGTAYLNRDHFKPCLFDLFHDEREEHDLSASMPELVSEMWAELNRTALTAFLSRSPAHLKGHCNSTCTKKHWAQVYGEEIDGPECGVAECS
mmetsp:Transcript_72805/g.129034  ORF Transcript_72805/g.129034 Transcript_72805/m.129034 type:complete len:617 (-) Transcript_72805:66-1916(-)